MLHKIAYHVEKESIVSALHSLSASGQTMQGDLPPSSRVTGLMRSAACFMMILPTSVLPVNATCNTMHDDAT